MDRSENKNYSRRSTDRQIDMKDQKKVMFCNEGGDFLTLLQVYQELFTVPNILDQKNPKRINCLTKLSR